MTTLDPTITQALQTWLNTPSGQRDILAGARLLFSLNRNRALYNTICRNPAKYESKVEYELSKHLRIRFNNMTVSDVVRLEATIMPSVSSIIDDIPTISSENELPEQTSFRGRRKDHDSLPPDIQSLWDKNDEIYKQMVFLFNELKAMHDAAPCDRFDKLKLLDAADKAYRKNLQLYDSYDAAVSASAVDADSAKSKSKAESYTDIVKQVGAARKAITTNKKILVSMAPDDPKREYALAKIRTAVSIIQSSGASLSIKTIDELQTLGITVC